MARRARTLSDLGEAALIERIARRAGRAPGSLWPLAIGDDAAVLRPPADADLVLSTDAQVENVHFRFEREAPRTIGRRALAVNLSDLAAMGAAPLGGLLSLAAPRSLEVAVFDALIDGVVAEGKRYGCPLVGGNLSRAQHCSLHVTVVGRVARDRALRRDTLRAGDEVFVTGDLGAAALARLRADATGRRSTRVPVPRLAAGRRLARWRETTACIDVSDGLRTDLAHLLEDRRLGAEIDASAVPRPRGFSRACASLGLDPEALLFDGGEDYELLFARRPGSRADRGAPGRAGDARVATADRLASTLGVRVTRIGRVSDRPGIRGLPARRRPGHHF